MAASACTCAIIVPDSVATGLSLFWRTSSRVFFRSTHHSADLGRKQAEFAVRRYVRENCLPNHLSKLGLLVVISRKVFNSLSSWQHEHQYQVLQGEVVCTVLTTEIHKRWLSGSMWSTSVGPKEILSPSMNRTWWIGRWWLHRGTYGSVQIAQSHHLKKDGEGRLELAECHYAAGILHILQRGTAAYCHWKFEPDNDTSI